MNSSLMQCLNTRLLLAPLLVLVAFLAACGGGGGGGEPAPAAPTITSQPSSQTVQAGQTATFSVAAAGDAPLAYQWLRDSSPIAGAVQSSYALASPDIADSNGRFAVRVSNAAGTVTSADAVLTVTPRPAVTPLGVSLFTGSIHGAGNLDGTGSEARLSFPGRFAVGAGDTLYVADRGARILRKITAAGQVSRLAGTGSQGNQDGEALMAQFSDPAQVVFDGTRNLLYVLDAGTIRRVTPQGQVSTLAGSTVLANGTIAAGPDGAIYATAGMLPFGFGDRMPTAIQKIPAQGGAPVLLAGSLNERASTDGNATTARFDLISSLAVDASGNVYAAEAGALRKVAPDGTVSTLAGAATNGFVDGTGSQARFSGIGHLVVEPAGSVLAHDSGNKAVRRITAQGVVSTVARDLPGNVMGMGIDSAGRIVFSMPHAVQRITADGSVQNMAGTQEPAAQVAFGPGHGLVVDSKGNVYTTVVNNTSTSELMAVRKYAPSGERVNFGPTGDVAIARRTGIQKSFGSTLAIDGADNIYEADQGAQGRIYKIAPNGSVSLVISGEPGGPAVSATLLTANASGTLFAADEANGGLLRITPAGQVTRMSDLKATFPLPYPWHTFSIAATNAGVVYLAHMVECTVYRIDPDGSIRLLAGRTSFCGSADGVGSAALFKRPYSLAVDSAGNVFVRDAELVRRITPDGTVTTVGGIAGQRGTQLGPLPRALADQYPALELFVIGERLAVGPDDVLYVEADKALLKLRLK